MHKLIDKIMTIFRGTLMIDQVFFRLNKYDHQSAHKNKKKINFLFDLQLFLSDNLVSDCKWPPDRRPSLMGQPLFLFYIVAFDPFENIYNT